MKSIRRIVNRKTRNIFLGLFASIAVLTLSYVFILNPLYSHAESLYMQASVTDDNGNVDFSPGIENATAYFSNQKTGGSTSDSKIYNARIAVIDLPSTATNKRVEIKLPVGMIWVDDASSNAELRSQLDTSKGNNGIGKVALDIEQVQDYAFSNSGTRIYYFSEGAVSLAINIKVKTDIRVDITDIESAISAKLFVDDFSEEANLKVISSSNASTGGRFVSGNTTRYVAAGTAYSDNFDNEKSIWFNFTNGNYGSPRLIKRTVVAFHVSDPAVTLRLTSNASYFSLDNSDAANGNYLFTFTPPSSGNVTLGLPYEIVIPSADQLNSTQFTVKETGVTYTWQVDGSERAVEYTATRTNTYNILPVTPDGVTVGLSNLNPSTSGTAFNVVAQSRVSNKEALTGILGYGYINNRSSSDSAVKEVHMTFDTEVIGVQLLRLAGVPNGKITEITVETKSGITKTVAVDINCNKYGLAQQAVSYSTFGVERDDYIKDIKYVIGVIPAGKQLRAAESYDGSQAFSFHGRRLDESRDGAATIEVYDVDDHSHTTGVAQIACRYIGDSGTIDFSFPGTKIVNAGNKLSFSYNIYPHGSTTMSYNSIVNNPIIYIRDEAKNAAGEFIPLTNLHIKNGDARGNEDITNRADISITYTDTATARVYKIDTSAVGDGSASLSTNAVANSGALSYLNLTLTFDIETSLTTPSQMHNIQDIVFVQNAANTAISTWNGRSGNPYNVGETGKTTVSAATNAYYEIRGWASIGVENSGKHTGPGDWKTWSEDAMSIAIGSAEGSIADMKTTLINNSGVDVPGPTTVYFPIPKKDQNWGSLSYDNKDFEFSTMLTEAISNPDSDHFVIAYGKNVTPTDDGAQLDGQSAKFTTDTTGWTEADWKEVNCVKIVATNIPANAPGTVDNYDFIYDLIVVDTERITDGATNTWRPLYFQQLTNSAGDIFAGWYKGSYVSVKLADGKIAGQLFIDANENGKKDATEQTLQEAGWKIDIYDTATGTLAQSTETDANGNYNFIELFMSQDGYYMNVTNKHPINDSDATYLFTPKGAASDTGAYNTDNQAEGSKTSSPAHTTALISPVSPSKTVGEATYNIGLVEYVANDAYQGTVTFNDQNNKYNTRPANFKITATANDGTVIDISAPAGGSWSANLPRYNDKGEKRSYTFSTNALTNYNKTDETLDNGHTYNVSYTQKTATLTVHHYKKNTTTPLANDETSTVYWGQTYTTAQATVDSNYEYDSIVGSASGPVAGDITVTYYYKLKRGTVITHYYIKDTTTRISGDTSKEYNYTETYTTSPLSEIPAAYANYELVSDKPDKWTGTVNKPTIDVIYYYQKKDASLSSSITLSAPETIDNKKSPVEYDISYSVGLKDYIGSVSTAIALKLPYPIVADESELDGGVYNETYQTIYWNNSFNHNTYTGGETLSAAYHISLVYDGALAKDQLVATAEATVTLDSKDNDAANSAETLVRTPSKIIFRYVDQDGNEIINSYTDDGFAGDESGHAPQEIPGYELIREEYVDMTFGEEERIIVYRYEKLPDPVNPKTFDNNLATYFIAAGALLSLAIYTISVSIKHKNY